MGSRAEKYAEVFATAMIEAIREGTAPWQKPWKRGESPYPRNFKTKRGYNGGNLLLLMTVGMKRGYGDPRWGGFGQIRSAGGQVRRGETGTPVLVVRNRNNETVNGNTGNGKSTGDARESDVYITVQHVFNVAQADGLAIEPLGKGTKPGWDPIPDVEDVAADARIEIREGPTYAACYGPSLDIIEMPSRGQFDKGDAFYHTLLHELGHATAHPSRMNRPGFTTTPQPQSAEYALEELRAEMAAMMTGARLRIGHSPKNGEAYVAHWLRAAGEDPNTVRHAARDAQAIANWLLRNRSEGKSETAELDRAA